VLRVKRESYRVALIDCRSACDQSIANFSEKASLLVPYSAHANHPTAAEVGPLSRREVQLKRRDELFPAAWHWRISRMACRCGVIGPSCTPWVSNGRRDRDKRRSALLMRSTTYYIEEWSISEGGFICVMVSLQPSSARLSSESFKICSCSFKLSNCHVPPPYKANHKSIWPFTLSHAIRP
jgi:hypothetical protein